MNNGEALDTLTNLFIRVIKNGIEANELTQNEINEIWSAINAFNNLVDKSIPKKPKVISKPYGNLIFKEYRCPVCNAQMGRNNCCSNNDCRQIIDWSKE